VQLIDEIADLMREGFSRPPPARHIRSTTFALP
jgi:hypothetical protein